MWWFHTMKKKVRQRFLPRVKTEIEPDEIFLDASNLPEFDQSQLEGRLEQPISKRAIGALGVFALLLGTVFLGKLFILQAVEGEAYALESEDNRLRHSLVFAERGVIYDRKGRELVWNAEDPELDFSLRRYIDTPGFSHLLGHVQYPLKDSSGIYYAEQFEGKAGVEEVFDATLSGENGLKIVETNALGQVKSESVIRPPQNGSTLTLSIDRDLEATLYGAISDTAQDRGFTGGAGILMDIESGEIIAMASYPEFSSAEITAGNEEALAQYVTDPRKPFLNRVTSGLYTPGSIVKPFMALGALAEGIIDPEKEILSTGSISIPNPYFPDNPTVFRDWKAHGWVDMREAIEVSADVYFYGIGGGFSGVPGQADQRGLGIENIEKYMRLFGFGAPTGIRFEGEGVGVVPNPQWKAEHFNGDSWLLGNTYHTSIGQYGFQVTPLQAVRAIGALASGFMVTPGIEKGTVGEKTHLPFSDEHLQIVREGMRRSAQVGTASGLSVPYVEIAAKTGTAELGARKDFVNSWVVGFFPYEKPRYAFAVIMERGPSSNLVGATSVARRFFDAVHLNAPEYLGN